MLFKGCPLVVWGNKLRMEIGAINILDLLCRAALLYTGRSF
ncbi:MAG: hypothetical protein QMD50_00145 [Patescibacteria group bacterium]|nr:hypothetical protein [Patescibacteria group bacterium]